MSTNEGLVSVVDRDGRTYAMSAEEAKVAVSSGAYAMAGGRVAESAPMRVMQHKSISGKVARVREKATGKVFTMQLIDAKEAVKTGFFEYAPSQEQEAPKATASVQKSEPVKQEVVQPAPMQEAAPEKVDPEITPDSPRKVLIQALRKRDIPYRKDMSDAELYEALQNSQNA